MTKVNFFYITSLWIFYIDFKLFNVTAHWLAQWNFMTLILCFVHSINWFCGKSFSGYLSSTLILASLGMLGARPRCPFDFCRFFVPPSCAALPLVIGPPTPGTQAS